MVKVVDSLVTELGIHEVGSQPGDHVNAGGVVAEGLGTQEGDEEDTEGWG